MQAARGARLFRQCTGLSQPVFLSSDYKNGCEATFSEISQSNIAKEGAPAAILFFSGFSTSRASFAQERSLYTTCVTASTARTSKKKIEQGSMHGADI
jgi:hypothetical protein